MTQYRDTDAHLTSPEVTPGYLLVWFPNINRRAGFHTCPTISFMGQELAGLTSIPFPIRNGAF